MQRMSLDQIDNDTRELKEDSVKNKMRGHKRGGGESKIKQETALDNKVRAREGMKEKLR